MVEPLKLRLGGLKTVVFSYAKEVFAAKALESRNLAKIPPIPDDLDLAAGQESKGCSLPEPFEMPIHTAPATGCSPTVRAPIW